MLTDEQIAWIEKEVYVICPIQYKENEFCEKRKKKIATLRSQVRERLTQKLLKEMADEKLYIGGAEIIPQALAGVKTASELAKMGIFSHLPKHEEEKFNKELWESLRKMKQAQISKPASDKKSSNPS